MNHSLSLSECVGEIRFESGRARVFATIDADYHADRHEVEVFRKAYITPNDMQHITEHLETTWLPAGDVVKAGCDAYEASDVARDIFHSWVRHVKESIPG
jgi:hypothetical protein